MKKKKPIDMSKVKPADMMKYEIAKELGLFDKILSQGWGALTSGESGRIGGIAAKRKRDLRVVNAETGGGKDD